MKCPKCHYLGFETGERCRNCGYDFSLLAAPASGSDLPDLDLHPRTERRTPGDLSMAPAGEVAPPALPLFADAADDEPLITLPAAPRPPMAVRRAPDTPRAKPAALVHLREHVAARRAASAEPQLAFLPAVEEVPVAQDDEPAANEPPPPAHASPVLRRSMSRVRTAPAGGPDRAGQPPAAVPLPEPCAARARVMAAVVDGAILASIDLIVVYFTIRMAGLTGDQWRLLPPVPLVLFLMMLKTFYFAGFTAIGGQTIGKMAARIRVVGDDGPTIDPVRAFQRTLAAGAALLTCGGTFIPALLGRERLAVHDRLAHTRVVSLPPA